MKIDKVIIGAGIGVACVTGAVVAKYVKRINTRLRCINSMQSDMCGYLDSIAENAEGLYNFADRNEALTKELVDAVNKIEIHTGAIAAQMDKLNKSVSVFTNLFEDDEDDDMETLIDEVKEEYEEEITEYNDESFSDNE